MSNKLKNQIKSILIPTIDLGIIIFLIYNIYNDTDNQRNTFIAVLVLFSIYLLQKIKFK